MPMSSSTAVTRAGSVPVREEAPNMNVRVPAWAPTTPPDMGASTNRPWPVACTALATSRETVGEMVEQSRKRRGGESGGRADSRIL